MNKFILKILGFLITILLIYPKLIKIHLPKHINEISIEMALVSIILFSISISFIIFFLIGKQTNKIKTRILDYFNSIYINSLTHIHDSILSFVTNEKFIENFQNKFIIFCDKIYNNCSKPFLFHLLLLKLPRLILSLCFAHETLLNNHIQFTYKLGMIMLIPILYRYFKFFIIDVAKDLYDSVFDHLIISEKENEITAFFKNEDLNNIKDAWKMNYYLPRFIVCKQIIEMNSYIEEQSLKYTKSILCVDLIINCIYMSLWLYILIHNLI